MKKTKEKLIIIDGNALIHRSFHALPATMKTKDGTIVNAVYGFALFLLKAIEEFNPQYIVLTLDKKAPTFRHEAYKEYKAQRVKAPQELYDQIPLVKKVATAFNIPIFELDGYEADDLIGTITRQVDSEVEKIIITGDLDTLQLVNSHTKVYTMSRGLSDSVLYNEDQVKNRFGLSPKQMIDYKGLRGDVSDNLPGVKGIGEKTASDLLITFKNLDGVYQAAQKADPKIKPRILELLNTHREAAYLSKELATINCQTPIKFSLSEAAFNNLEYQKILSLFTELEFKSLIPKIHLLEKYFSPEKNNLSDQQLGGDKFARDQKEFKYHLIDDEKKFQNFLTKLSAQKIFTFDTETTSLNPFVAKLLGISFSWKAGEAYYLAINPQSATDNLFATQNNEVWLKELNPIFSDARIKKCGHNLKFDYRILAHQGLTINGLYFDTMIASYLLNPEGRQHNLDALTFAELGFEKINHEDLLGSVKQKDFTQAPLEKLFIYACEDADMTNRLVKILEKKLAAEKLTTLFDEIEMPLIAVLARLEDNGLLVDQNILKNLQHELSQEVAGLTKNIWKLAGDDFNINSPKQLKEILYDKLKISTQGIKKNKTGLSTASDELEKLKNAHPIIPFIQTYRELSKLLSTYIEALPELINPHTRRLHTSLNQTITATGRLSSTEPNLQNIPTRTEIGRKIRTAFVAAPRWQLISLDYSQIELRIAAHLSGDKKMMAAFQNNLDIHTQTAAAIHNLDINQVTAESRREAKAINFGIIYGQGPHGLSINAGIPYNQARDFIDKYFTTYAGVRDYITQTIKNAKENGYVETILGRRRYLPDINSSMIMLQKAAERMAINMPFQGTAADMIKKAMIKIHELIKDDSNIKMILQVHDELIFEIKTEVATEYTKKIKAIMENVVKLKVPVLVETKQGSNWGALK